MKNVVIIGYGEIGKAVAENYMNTDYITHPLDIDNDPGVIDEVEVMHICIPFNKDFKENVINYYYRFKPKLTVINSTTSPGTTNLIYLDTGAEIVMSPCMGVHPELGESMRTFQKIFGAETETAAEMAKNHFEEIGFKPAYYGKTVAAEMAKLLSTTRYGNEIMFLQDSKKACDRYDLDIDVIYGKTTDIYNEGYKAMGLEKFTRPKLQYMGDMVGGHCIVPNAQILLKAGLMERTTGALVQRGDVNHVTQEH